MSCCCGPSLTHVFVDDDTLSVELCDGRIIVVPLAWYPRLVDATPQQRAHWQIEADGNAICWPDIDEWVYVGELLGDSPLQHEVHREMEASYRAMALDEDSETEALEWIEAVIGDVCGENDEDVDYEAKVLELAESII